MKRSNLLFLAAVLFACSSSRIDTSSSDAEALRARLQAWPRAAEAGDIDRYLTFVTDDVMVLAPGQAPLRGKQQLTEFLRTAVASSTFKVALQPPDEIVVADNWAYLRYRLQMTVTPKTGGASTTFDRKYMDIWQRGTDGVWRCHRHMFNDNPPA